MTADELWRSFRATGDPAALGALFDAVSPELFRIALSLAPDAASAEDALQETWLVALKSSARHDGARPVVPWLVGILRREVHAVRRRARMPDERRIAQRRPPDDPAISAESAEDVARARAALDALPATYREVAVLRWRYGLEPGEIADARSMAPGTVRSLLHRALARLRRDVRAAPALLLDVRWPRGLDDVRKTVLRAGARESAAGATAAGIGGLIVAKATKTALILAAACLLVGAGTVWTYRDGGDATPTRTAEVAGTVAPTRHAAAQRLAAPGRAAAPEPSAAAASGEPPAEKPFARGIVVDQAGAPIAGCRVLVRGHEDMGGIQDAPVRLDGAAAAVTGADGRFVVPKKPDDLASLTFVADRHEAVEERSFGADLRVVLTASNTFAARVVDTSGAPLAGVDVRMTGTSSRSDPRMPSVWLRAETDAAGRFEFLSMPKDARLTSISCWGYRLRGPRMGSLPEQDVYVLERSSLIVDVVDAATRAPLPGARGVLVLTDGALIGSLEPQTELAGDRLVPGRISCARNDRWGAIAAELRVFAPGHRTLSRPLTIPAEGEPPYLTVTLEPGDEPPVIAGRVEGGAGAVVAVRFSAPRTLYGSDLHRPVAASATAGADGTFSFTGIPGGRYGLTVTRVGEPPLSLDVDVPSTSLDLRFPPKADLVVRYTDAAGAPIADAWMHVQTGDERFGWDVRTDADGVARFVALPAGDVIVLPVVRGVLPLAQLGGAASLGPMPFRQLTLAAGTAPRLDLVRPDRCRVAIIVRDETGRPLSGVTVQARTERGLGAADRDEQGRLKALDLATDDAGRVSFDVFPCEGRVIALRQGARNSAEFCAGVGSSPTVELVLPSVTGTVRGRVVERRTGAAVANRPVRVWWDGKVIARSATGDDGRFTAGGVPGGRVHVTVLGSTDADDSAERLVDPKSPYGSASVEFDMQPGEDRSLAFTLPRIKGEDAEHATTAVEATVVDDSGAPVERASVSVSGLIDGAWCSLGGAVTDKDGRARVAVAAAGRYLIAAGIGTRRASVEHESVPSIVERLLLRAK